MAWFALARSLFVAAVGYSAHQLQPFGADPFLNTAFGLVLGLLIVVVEFRLRTTSVTHMIGALLGGAIGLITAKTIGAALYWANLGNERVVFLHSVILLALPYLGLVIGARRGRGSDTRCSIPASSSTAASRTSARRGSWTVPS